MLWLALGEKDVDVSGITPGQRFVIHDAVLAYATAKPNYGEAEVDQLITDAERRASRRGWNPLLATRASLQPANSSAHNGSFCTTWPGRTCRRQRARIRRSGAAPEP